MGSQFSWVGFPYHIPHSSLGLGGSSFANCSPNIWCSLGSLRDLTSNVADLCVRGGGAPERVTPTLQITVPLQPTAQQPEPVTCPHPATGQEVPACHTRKWRAAAIQGAALLTGQPTDGKESVCTHPWTRVSQGSQSCWPAKEMEPFLTQHHLHPDAVPGAY